jgi:hypothetical protein
VYRSELHRGQCAYEADTWLTASLAAISGSESDQPPYVLPRGAMPKAEIPRLRCAADPGTRQV